jgi:hypothetical protein
LWLSIGSCAGQEVLISCDLNYIRRVCDGFIISRRYQHTAWSVALGDQSDCEWKEGHSWKVKVGECESGLMSFMMAFQLLQRLV